MRFRSQDAARVESTWNQYIPSTALLDADPRRFVFDWHSADLGGVSLIQYDLAAQVHSTVEPHDQFLVCKVDGPGVCVRSDRGVLPSGRPWVSDGPRMRAEWSERARVTALVFDHDTLQQMARRISGDDSLALRATGRSPWNAASAAAWEHMFARVEEAVRAVGDQDQLLKASMRRYAASITLAAFPTTWTGAGRRSPQSAPAPATVRRALDYIAANAHLPITVEDIAATVHISSRGLQYAFRRALDTTPAETLRRARLDGAHRELSSGDPTSVALVARRWGFSHPSRFAAAYRAAFGVVPSVTLARCRR